MNVTSVSDFCCKDNGLHVNGNFRCLVCGYKASMSKQEYLKWKFDESPKETKDKRVFKDEEKEQ